MAKQPSFLPYNDLNGQETTEILVDWFRQLLSKQPLLQPHLTLPMADIHLTVHVGVDMHVGGTVPVASAPEHLDIDGDVTVRNAVAGPSGDTYVIGFDPANGLDATVLSTRINAAPLPGGSPPDQIRDSHNLPIPAPRYGPRETGSHLFLSDVIDATATREHAQAHTPTPGALTPIPQAYTPATRKGIVADGYIFAPECPTATFPVSVTEQTIPLATGRIDIDLSGDGKLRTGRSVSEMGPMAKSSVKSFGDSAGYEYGAVTGTMDAGPAGLARGGGNKGLGGDGRARLSFGNNR